MNTILLPTAALLIAVLLVIIYFTKRNMINEETKIYSKMLIINLIYSVLALITFIYAKTLGHVFVIEILQKIYMISMIALTICMILYNAVISNFNKKTIKKINTWLNISFSIFSLLILITPLNVINYGDILDGNGLSYDITLLATIIYLIIIVISTLYIFIKNKNVFSKDIPFVVLIIFYIIGIIIRNYFPYIMFENFFFSFMLLIMYFTIENPDLKMLEEFHKTKEYAENSNNEKATFLFNVSSWVKKPANKINALSKELLMCDDIDEIKFGLTKIKNNSNNLLDVIDNVLNISSNERRSINIVEKEYTPYTLFKGLETNTNLKIKNKNIEFKMIYDKTIPQKLYGDSIRIKQIMMALLDNSVKYTKNGYIELSVNSVIRYDKCRLIITVEDSGSGIKSEQIETLFDKSKLYTDDLKNIDDTKMNLGMVKSLLDLIGGVIMVNSEPGKGTKFTITLDQMIANSSKSKIIKDVEKYEKTLSKKSILLIMKGKRIEKKLVNILDDYELKIDIVHTKEELTKKLRKKYDLIITEEKLDKFNSMDVYSKLDKNSKTPIILLLNNADIVAIKAYQKIGFNEVELLPLKEGQIESILEKYDLNK